MLGKKISAILLSTALIGGCTATAQPIVLEDQGSFMAGGKTITAKGTFDAGQPMNEVGKPCTATTPMCSTKSRCMPKPTASCFCTATANPENHGKPPPTGAKASKISF